MISDRLIYILTKIILSSCSKEDIKIYEKDERTTAIEFMFDLCGINNVSMYIPGETLDNKKMSKFIISKGILINQYLSF